MVAEIRLDIEGLAEPARRAEANDRPTLRAPPMVQRCVLGLSEGVMRRRHDPIAVRSSFPATPPMKNLACRPSIRGWLPLRFSGGRS
jgi:hypothetical protein